MSLSPSTWPVRTKLAATFAASFLAVGLLFIAVNFGIIEPLLDEPADTDAVASALGGIAAVTAISLPAGWWIAGRLLRPVQSVTETTRRISAANLDERIALSGPDDELQELADTIDGLLDRLESSFERERRFVANASHELRTPLAVTRAALELGQAADDKDRALCTALEATGRSERLVDELLLLARVESTAAGDTDQVDLAELAREVCHDHADKAARADLTVHTELAPAPTEGVAGLLDRLVVNLIDNGLHHNVPAGQLTVTTRSTTDHSVLVVESTTAHQLDPAQAATLFEPFQRGDPSRHHPDRHGLGLSIVRAIAALHGGEAAATTVAGDPPRFRVTVRLPQDGSMSPDR